MKVISDALYEKLMKVLAELEGEEKYENKVGYGEDVDLNKILRSADSLCEVVDGSDIVLIDREGNGLVKYESVRFKVSKNGVANVFTISELPKREGRVDFIGIYRGGKMIATIRADGLYSNNLGTNCVYKGAKSSFSEGKFFLSPL